jgi:multidrug efflux pump
LAGTPNLSDWALRHRALVWFLMVMILAAGIFSYRHLGRNEDPAFTVKVMIVQASWPGATVQETIQEVTDRIERKLQETPGLDSILSYTTAGHTTVFVNLSGAIPGSEVAQVWYQVRKKMDDIRGTLPAGVLGPGFNDEFGDTYGIVYAFTADGYTPRQLRDYVESSRSKLLQVSDVSKIDIFGAQDEKIYIEFSSRQLAGLKLDRTALIGALRAQNAVTPAGVVETADERILVQVTGGFHDADDLRRVNFVVDGRIFRLSDIATVRRGYSDPPQPMFRYNGVPAIGLGIAMRNGGDVLALGRNITAVMRTVTAGLPVGIEPHLVAAQPQVVRLAVNDFMAALWEAIAIVLGVSFLSLGVRAGAVVACSIPLVLAAVFVTMEISDIDLQRVSLGALIIALGLLVDDAMITVEMMVTKLEEGMDKVRAATFAYTSTAFPMLTGTLVTAAGFVPVGFAKSAAGEYTFSMFAVVTMALLTSWIVAVVFAPLIGVAVLPDKMPHRSSQPGAILSRFRTLLVRAMRARRATIGIAVALLLLAVLALRLVPQQFFPASDRPELLVDLTLSRSASIYASDRVTTRFEKLLQGDADIDHWSSYIGQGAVRFYLPLNVQLPNDFFSQVVIVTKSLAARERLRARLSQALSEQFPEVVARLSPLELGPPVGWPLQYRISGPDPQKVSELAYQAAAVVASDARTQSINFNWIEPMRTLRIRVNQDEARLLGVSSQTLAQSLNAVVSGINITQIRDDIYLIDVIARAGADERISPATLKTLAIPLPNGKSVPLLQLASIEYGLDWPLVWRRDRLATITVSADLVGAVLPATVIGALEEKMAALQVSFPAGYHVQVGGTAEESAKSLRSVAAGLPLAALIMLIVLMVQLQSVSRLFLVLSVAPFGLIGVVAALLIAQKPMGFVAILGIIALVGMIVRNSVILVHQIETEIKNGRSRWDAVVEATLNRFRPILLTAAAAVFGMIPIAPTVFWGPMALAIMGGLTVATVLTLLFLPALYIAWFGIREDEPPPARATA